jgi:hypothetical protein
MRTRILAWLALFAITCTCWDLHAQEFSFLAGAMNTPDVKPNGNGYSWQIDYRHGLYRNVEISFAWVNEGHVLGHHRDGNAVELWYRLPYFANRFRLSFGVGPYYYYDTQPIPGSTDSVNLHGTAPIYSLSAEGEIYDRWFWRFLANRINAKSDIKTNTAVFGVGYWLGREPGIPKGNLPGILEGADAGTGSAKNEVTAFGGWSVVNTLFSEGAHACGAEYRRNLTPNLDGTISYIYEGDPHVVRRSGAGLQIWPVSKSFGGHFEVGFGVGTYVYIDRKHEPRPNQKTKAALAGLVSPMVSYRVTDAWFVRLIWNRVVTNYSRDSDIWLLGIGYRL